MPAAMQADDADNANADLALVYLNTPEMDLADSHRPMVWNGWDEDGWFGDYSAAFGIAGYSPYAGPWECPSEPIDPGPTDYEHEHWRQRAEPMDMLSFGKLPGDDTIT
jgi:hypothetical protein